MSVHLRQRPDQESTRSSFIVFSIGVFLIGGLRMIRNRTLSKWSVLQSCGGRDREFCGCAVDRGLTRAGNGLAAANPNIDRTGHDAANSVFIDNAQFAVTEREIHGLRSRRIKVDAKKSCKLTDSSVFDTGVGEIKLHDVLAVEGTRVRHANRHRPGSA